MCELRPDSFCGNSADASPPSVASIARAVAQPALTSSSPLVFNVTFSEPVSGVTAALFRYAQLRWLLSRGISRNFFFCSMCSTSTSTATITAPLTVTAMGSLSWSVSVTPDTSGSVVLRVDNAALGAVSDLAGNALSASGLSATITYSI